VGVADDVRGFAIAQPSLPKVGTASGQDGWGGGGVVDCDWYHVVFEPGWVFGFRVRTIRICLVYVSPSQGLNADLFIPRLVMLLTKEHTPHSAVLGSTNAVVELIQMIGYMIGPPFIT
jgi:hypothetical protein